MNIFKKIVGRKGNGSQPNSKEQAHENIETMNSVLFQVAMDALNDGSPDRAFQMMKTVAESGRHVDAMFNLGMFYIRGIGTDVNVDEGIKWLTKAAEAGDDQAAYNVAIFYHDGKIVERDLHKALYWYKVSADLGNHKAMFEYTKLVDMVD